MYKQQEINSGFGGHFIPVNLVKIFFFTNNEFALFISFKFKLPSYSEYFPIHRSTLFGMNSFP